MIVAKKFCCLIAFVLFSLAAKSAQAHFIWVYAGDGAVKLVFGEGLEPDQAQFLAGLSAMKGYSVVDGKAVELEFTKKIEDEEGWFEIPADQAGGAVDVACAYGVFGRGDKTMFLDYSAKYLDLSKYKPTKPSGKLNLDLIPSVESGQWRINSYFNGLPVAGIEIQVTRLESETVVSESDESGSLELEAPTRFVIRAKHVVEEAGEVDGKEFAEKRYYCTLVMDVGKSTMDKTVADATKGDAKSSASHQAGKYGLRSVDAELPLFPKGMTSFGATVSGDCIYVIGGKSGRAHSYAKSYQNRDVYCLDVSSSDKQWKSVGENLGLQGLAIVARGGKLYRIGGLEAKNKEGDEHDLHSVAAFLEFDPAEGSWRELPNLPQGRSSFDACMIGDQVFVLGGWTMKGDQDSEWATQAYSFDLSSPDSGWQAFDTPFQTRANAVEALGNKLYVIGGIKQSGGPTNEVHVYDLASKKWSVGPEVPTDGRLKAFGCSALSLDGHLLVSTYDGGVFRLNDQSDAWEKIHELDAGRFFHHMVPVGKSTFALVGGSHMEHGSHFEVEVFEVTTESAPEDVSKSVAKTGQEESSE